MFKHKTLRTPALFGCFLAVVAVVVVVMLVRSSSDIERDLQAAIAATGGSGQLHADLLAIAEASDARRTVEWVLIVTGALTMSLVFSMCVSLAYVIVGPVVAYVEALRSRDPDDLTFRLP